MNRLEKIEQQMGVSPSDIGFLLRVAELAQETTNEDLEAGSPAWLAIERLHAALEEEA